MRKRVRLTAKPYVIKHVRELFDRHSSPDPLTRDLHAPATQVQVLHARGKVHLGDIPCEKGRRKKMNK
jgi:hypothetical protein